MTAAAAYSDIASSAGLPQINIIRGGSDGPAAPAMAGPLLSPKCESTFSPTTTFTHSILYYTHEQGMVE